MSIENDGVELSISELADLLHTSKSALRYYEREGLITPERATSSGYRRYSFQSLIELSDVMLYRKLGVPVKEIRSLLDSPISQTSATLDVAEEELLAQMRQITDTLEQITARRRHIRLYHATRSAGYRLVEQPAVSQLYRFDLIQMDSMGAYLSRPEDVRYAAYFPDANQPTSFVDAAISAYDAKPLDIVWTRPDTTSRWLECLMRTEYSLTGNNNLAEHVAYLRERGFDAGQVIAEYLTFDFDERQGRRTDFYRIWIEVFGDGQIE